jgi:hypothetical protein
LSGSKIRSNSLCSTLIPAAAAKLLAIVGKRLMPPSIFPAVRSHWYNDRFSGKSMRERLILTAIMFYALLLVLPLSPYPQLEREREGCNSAFFALMTTIFGSFCAACWLVCVYIAKYTLHLGARYKWPLYKVPASMF